MLLKTLLQNKTYPNLWDVHPPFQIDGNFGATAGLAEMLLQSHDGQITLVASVPTAWNNIKFSGLKARGNFTVSCNYKSGLIKKCEIKSCSGGILTLNTSNLIDVKVFEKSTKKEITAKSIDGAISFNTEKGKTYVIKNVKVIAKNKRVNNLQADWEKKGVKLTWKNEGLECAIYRAKANDKDYTLIGLAKSGEFLDSAYTKNNKERLSYKVVVVNNGKYLSSFDGEVIYLNPASALEIERYNFRFKQNNININN